MPERSQLEPSVLQAVLRHRWLVGACVVGAVLVGAGLTLGSLPTYVARASLIVEDPRGTAVFQQQGRRPEDRYVADQVQILRSLAVATRASQLVAEELTPAPEPADILGSSEVAGRTDSNTIDIRYRTTSSQLAVAGANALGRAYQDVLRTESSRTADNAIERLNALLVEIRSELGDVQTTIADSRSGELDELYQEAIAELPDLWAARAAAATEDQRTAIDARIDELTRQIEAREVAGRIEQSDSRVSDLVRRQDQLLARRQELETRRDQILVDSELEAGGVVLFSPAQDGVRTGDTITAPRPLALAVVVGLILGIAFAYFLELRRRTFNDRAEPALVLGVPLLSEIPHFRHEGITSPLPVLTDAVSASSEAFRFAASAIRIPLQSLEGKTFAVVSGTVGAGKTTIAANTGLAMAAEGGRVLLIDADFGNQALSQMLLDDASARPGITEVVLSRMPLHQAVQRIPVNGAADGHSVSLLARGQLPVTAPDFFGSEAAHEFLRSVGDAFDLVIIDAPPLLQVAYASTLVRQADACMVIVPHRGAMAELEELADRLQFIDTPVAGYIYNRAPLRAEMTTSEGSMMDVLGHGSSPPAARGAVDSAAGPQEPSDHVSTGRPPTTTTTAR